MASTYSNLKIQLMATGENSTTWGNVTNINLGTALEEAIAGSADVAFSSANVTLTLTDTNATQTARNMRLNLTGTATAGYNLIVPAIEKPYIINNGTDGTITVKNATGTGVAVPTGTTMWVYNDGTNVSNVVSYLTSLTTANLTATNVTATNVTATNVTTTNLTATTVLDPSAIGAASPGFRGLPQNSQTSAYTLALTDAGKHISITTGGVVVPANSSIAFPIGTAVVIFNNSGTSQNVSITTDTMYFAGTATTGTRALAQRGLATCVKVASTTWVISGAGLS
jgi:hypothetical protein